MKFTRIIIRFGEIKNRKRHEKYIFKSHAGPKATTGTTKTENQNEIIIPIIYAVNRTVYYVFKTLNIESSVVNMNSNLVHKLCGRCLSIFGEWNLERGISHVILE